MHEIAAPVSGNAAITCSPNGGINGCAGGGNGRRKQVSLTVDGVSIVVECMSPNCTGNSIFAVGSTV